MVVMKPKPGEISKIPPSLETLLDLLNRDQRTIVTIKRCERERFERSTNHIDISSSNGFNEKITGRTHRGPVAPNSVKKLMCRLGEVFIVGVCLLTIVRIPTVMSAPSTRHAKEIEQMHFHKPTEDRNFVHPCKNNSYYKAASASNETNPDILKNIIIVAKTALGYAEEFRDSYVEETFQIPFKDHHAHWKSERYDWLPSKEEIPKSLGEKLNRLHLTNHSLDRFLINIYEYMQRFAIGLKQVAEDQKEMEGKFRKNFIQMSFRLNNVLHELRDALYERNLCPLSEISPNIMESKYRYIPHASNRNVRDWLIFRDLMNGLEYCIEVFSYIENESAIAAPPQPPPPPPPSS